jgi:hypothetical protein
MKYLSLFSLEILHDFYADQRCNDFEVAPTPETQKLLVNHRALLKSHSNRMQIIVPVAGNGLSFIPFLPGTLLYFQLRLQNSMFPLFTDLTEISQTISPAYTNTGADSQLQLVSRPVKATESFSVHQPQKKEPFILQGQPRPGLQRTDFTVRDLGTVSKPTSYEPATKQIIVNTEAATAGALFRVEYPVSPRPGRGVLAEVEIKLDNNLIRNVGGKTSFQILFKAKQARWKYYVVLDRVNHQALQPSIQDDGRAILFNPEDRTDLVQTPDPSDPVAARLARLYPDLQTFRFVSSSLVPCREAARKAIQLHLDGDKVVDALPNPLIQNYVVDVRNNTKEDALYQVVNYFTRPFS